MGRDPADRTTVTAANQRRRSPSIRDVAREAGVSRQTVSRVINNHPSLRPETRDRVLQVIEQMRYRPNAVARALGRNSSHVIGVLALQRTQYGPIAAIQAIEEAAVAYGFVSFTVPLTDTSSDMIREGLEFLVSQQVAGIVVIAPQRPVLKEVTQLELDIPYVLLHSRVDDETDLEIFADQRHGARLAVAHLADQGHRRIAHLAGPADWMEAEARLHGYRDELTARGLDPLPVVHGDWSSASGAALADPIVASGATAVFCSNDQMALGLIHAVRLRNLSVPEDVSVVGFDDIPEAAYFAPPLTTVRQDFASMGRRCVARLITPPPGAPMAATRLDITPASTVALVVRESVRNITSR
ncbi:LacI family transcriptional regulator [Enemella evansiae]|nr:LacI family transcriptional regulator [Enemella evansiae]OYN98777.1 LacI family transcriptional regulator [Enemella evansiae]OYO01867.1 LacI family transcriptional regulator [Enemella evansiae]OYO10960.1 LacI family transcriptional regulator [Enemella evansiae]